MEASVLDAERVDDPNSDVSSTSTLATHESSGSQHDRPVANNPMSYETSAEGTFNPIHQELTVHAPGDVATHQNNNGASTNQTPHYEPRALLNPNSANFKRPASSGGDADRGRPEPTIAGQVSLVERLHNVQERTASPAKRVKTGDPRNQNGNHSNFSGGSALGLQNPNGQAPPPLPRQGPPIDLTMSKSLESLHITHPNQYR
jgi:hypothetical protein